jgi:hypothetical protein
VRASLDIRKTRTGEVLEVHRHGLMYFVDETGHEDFANPEFPVFGMGGCAILAAAIEQNLRAPWRSMKDCHFGGADIPLHASDLRSPSREQLAALKEFFETQTFGRFAVTLTRKTQLRSSTKPIRRCLACFAADGRRWATKIGTPAFAYGRTVEDGVNQAPTCCDQLRRS